MKTLFFILPFTIQYGLNIGGGKCTGTVNTTISYSWTDTVYLDVSMEDTNIEERIFYVGDHPPKLNDKITFDCSQVIKVK
jgi:hypothetical protein